MTIFVNCTSGNDGNDGLRGDRPVKTFARANELLAGETSGTIALAPGDYGDPTLINNKTTVTGNHVEDAE